MLYELWDVKTANLVGAYETEDEALAVVREAAGNHGRGYLASWALAVVTPAGEMTTIARGQALATRACKPIASQR